MNDEDPSRRNQQSCSSSSVEDHNGEEIAENEKEVRRASYTTIFTAELVSTLLASIISYAIFSHTRDSPLAMELSHR